MSHQEFENYLTLLTRLLKVAPSQREQLAQEFRAHLEDRLDELLASGMERDQAVQQAISEFGDAAGLAVELATIAQRRKRRFLMKVSYASAGALALAGLLVFALWPEGRQVQGPPQAEAQAPDQDPAAAAQPGGSSTAAAASQPPAATPDRISLAHQRIRAALDQEVELDYLDTPLFDVVQHLNKISGVPVILSTATLADAAVTGDTPVTSSLQGISLRSALRIMLGELKLTYVIRDEVLQITTPEDAEGELFTRIYDCRELLALPSPPGSSRPKGVAGGGGFFAVENEPVGKTAAGEAADPAAKAKASSSPGQGHSDEAAGEHVDGKRPLELSDAEHLMSLITTTVDPASWDEVGGPGTIAEYKGLLVVTQTAEVHEQVERLLNMLHQAAGLEEQRVKVVE